MYDTFDQTEFSYCHSHLHAINEKKVGVANVSLIPFKSRTTVMKSKKETN